MSDDKNNPYNEKTVVQSRQSFSTAADDSEFNSGDENSADEMPAPPQSQEKTVVFAKSNLKETFDARTVVMTKPVLDPARAPAPSPAPAAKAAPTLPPAAPESVSPAVAPAPVVLAVEIPAPTESTDPGVKVQTGSFAMKASDKSDKTSDKSSPEEAPKKKATQEDRRTARKALDRKTKTMVAAFATLCALIVLCVLVAFGGPKGADGAKVADAPVKQKETTDMASTSDAPTAGRKTPQGLPDYQSTTDVLGKFDRAAQKAQQHAF